MCIRDAFAYLDSPEIELQMPVQEFLHDRIVLGRSEIRNRKGSAPLDQNIKKPLTQHVYKIRRKDMVNIHYTQRI